MQSAYAHQKTARLAVQVMLAFAPISKADGLLFERERETVWKKAGRAGVEQFA
jgi:uncharacterized membrane protein YebE (DUF533 family)